MLWNKCPRVLGTAIRVWFMKNMFHLIPRPFYLLTLQLLLVGCTSVMEVDRLAPYSAKIRERQAGFSPAEEKLISKHCPFGMPQLNRDANFGPAQLVAHEGYVLMHSSVDKIPLWVCEFVSRDQLMGSLTRETNPFAPDPALLPGQRAELSDYASTGFDRGHQAPAGDQTKDEHLKDETFFLSNMAPQDPKLNRLIWKKLESMARNWAKGQNGAYIITGPMFYDPKEESEATATGTIKHKVIGRHAIAVPTHFYKIIVAKKQNRWEAIGFVLENKQYAQPYHFDALIKPIEWIEKRTGITFMPDLEAPDRNRLKHIASPLWN
jgi:DNA/RNA endonuclease G (NUC1)